MTVRCSICQYDNPGGSGYCQSCGSALAKVAAPPVRIPQQSGYELRGRDGTIYPLPGVQMQIGRQPGCEILLAESSVSGRHALLTQQGAQWFLQDLGSSNGTRINGVRLTPHQVTPVQPGSVIELGGWQGALYSPASGGAHPSTTKTGSGSGSGVAPQPPLLPGPATSGRLRSLAKQVLGLFPAALRAINRSFSPKAGSSQLPVGAVTVGIVTNALPDEAMEPPRDASKILLKLSIWVLLLGGLAVLGMASWVWIAIAFLPVLLLLWLFRLVGVFLMPFGMFSLFSSKKAQAQGPIGQRGFHWSVADSITNQGVSGSLVRKPRQGGNLTPGDEVAVYGRINRNNLVEAYAIVVTQRSGNPIGIRIEGIRPWPIWIGLLGCAASVGSLIGFAYYLNVL